jgi:hypothetical protein
MWFRHKLLSLLMLGSFCLLGTAAFAADSGKGDGAKTPWKITGQLEESCSCDAACPCWMDSKPTRMNCSGGQVVFIEKGSYGGVSLDGLALGMVGQSPDNKSMMESMGNWNFLTIYVDEKASPEQRRALEAIARETVPPAASPEHTHIRYVPITRAVSGAEHTVRIGDVEIFKGHLVEGGLGGTTKIVNPPGADPIHREYEQGRTSELKFTGEGQKWDWSNTNYMFASFDVDSDQYSKFNAAMMKKMAGGETKK